MSPTAVLAVQLVVVIGGVVALAVALRRRLGRPWRTWWWGALAFVASQVVRLPVLAGLGAVGVLGPGDGGTSVVAAVVLSLSAGVFEEASRWLVLRFGARDARRWADGVVFGAGHGGIEAVLLIGVSVAGGLALLAGGDSLVDLAPDAASAEAVAAQLEALRAVTAGQAALAVWERVLAIAVHVAMALLVLRAVRDRAPVWLLVAVAAHTAFNLVAVGVLSAYGPLAAEAALTVVAVGALAVIRHERHRDAAGAAPDSTAAPDSAAAPDTVEGSRGDS